MSTQIVDSIIGWPVLAAKDDRVLVKDIGAVLMPAAGPAWTTYAITTQSRFDGTAPVDTGITVRVAGTVQGGKHAINLPGTAYATDDSWIGEHKVVIDATGLVSGRYAISLSGNDNTVINRGQLMTQTSGTLDSVAILGSGNRGTVVNHGQIGGTGNAGIFDTGAWDVLNTGTITGFGGMTFASASGSAFHNTGHIEVRSFAVQANSSDRMDIVNSGTMISTAGHAAGVFYQGSVSLLNTGTMHGAKGAMNVYYENLHVVNKGVMSGDEAVFRIEYFDLVGGRAVIRNDGLIQGPKAIWLSSGAVSLENQGEIRGEIALLDEASRIVNNGKIEGAVQFGWEADFYLAGDTGRVIGAVLGGEGDDRLIGGHLRDRFHGEGGNDLLRGRGGNDRLDGGAGDDVLTGGTGHDRFVFALGGGQDEITDFQDDIDTLELDQALWGDGLTKAQVLATYASPSGADTVLDFGNGDVVVIRNIAPGDLLDDILLV